MNRDGAVGLRTRVRRVVELGDLKPTNIMVGLDGRVRVLDFGLARQLSFSDTSGGLGALTPAPEDPSPHFPHAEPLTDSKLLMGTPGYMAPEQYAHGILDARTDQFAFCVTLYEALYDRRPFRGRTLAEIQAATMCGELPEAADDRPVPAWLRAAIVRGTRPDPAERYGSLDELLADLVVDRRVRRRRSWGALAFVLVAVLAFAGMWRLRPDPPVDDRIEQLANEARAAAAKIYFVFPPPEDPSAPTAYRIVQELERLEGELADAARVEALALRHEFSNTLTRLGDRYWNEDGARPFAIDYYVGALVFVPDNARARERAAVTPGELIAMRTKVAVGDFTKAELEAAQTLVVLADDDEIRRREEVARIVREHGERATTTRANLERILRIDAAVAASSASETTVVPGPAIAPAPAAPASASSNAVAPPSSASSASAKPKAATSGEAGHGREAAKLHVERARAALRSGGLKDAETQFHRALEADRSNADALAGLSELYFDQGAYQRALEFARRGVKAAPKSGRHHIILGDCSFKVLRYTEARAAYEAARTLGHPSAKGRLERLDDTLGAK